MLPLSGVQAVEELYERGFARPVLPTGRDLAVAEWKSEASESACTPGNDFDRSRV